MHTPRFVPLLVLVPLLALGGCVGVAVRAAGHAHDRADPGQMFERADANGDGRITRDEFVSAHKALFTRLDRDGDGYLTSADAPRRLRNRGGGEGQAAGLRLMDTDGDGRISRQEFIDGSLKLFDRADANHDGVVDSQEVATFKAAVTARRGK
jgi:Ca2+-binding EF-hand superfamily protein